MTPASPQPGRRTTDSTAREEIARIIDNWASVNVVTRDACADAILAALPGIVGSEEAVERAQTAFFAFASEPNGMHDPHGAWAAALRAAVGEKA